MSDEKLPVLNLNVPQPVPPPSPIATIEEVANMCAEIMGCLRDDRDEADDTFHLFKDMVINDGDASMASKQSMVEFFRLRTDATDKMTKIMEILLRTITKDQGPKQVTAKQENKFIFTDSKKKREFLQRVDKTVKENKEKK